MEKNKFENFIRVNHYILLFARNSECSDRNVFRTATYDQALQTLECLKIIECIGQPFQDCTCRYQYVNPSVTQVDLVEIKGFRTSSKQ
ncbi:hypothetical protein [Alkalihalobacillus deserti]|uniref:hypothetical protein n=1 Tax=Alkalihalobacillus deserti TaxID=2879466 RepID=UPI001D133E36|nr:hypothetical protein [Alkalihalobacillus deserti]